jgi:hypothetical protein
MLEKAKKKWKMTYCKMKKEHNEKQFMIYYIRILCRYMEVMEGR